MKAPLVCLLLASAIACTTHASAQREPPLPPPVVEATPVNDETPANPSNPAPPIRDEDRPRDSAIDLHLDTGWSLRHFDTLTLKAPDFGAGVGMRGPGAAVFFVLRFAPGTTKEDLVVRNYGFDLDIHLIWGHFRLEFGLGGDVVTVNRVTRDNTIIGSFVKLDLGPRVDLVQWEPLTVFVRAQGMLGGGDGLYSGVLLGGGIELDVAKLHPSPRPE